jgi:multicomponent Na+:H+ antiporter subunit G
MEYVGMALMVVGLFFLLVGAIGVVRFPDIYSRSHAVGLTDSIGALFALSGLALYQGFSGNLVRVLMVLALMYLLNPVMTHATVRAALRSGVKPWSRDDEGNTGVSA